MNGFPGYQNPQHPQAMTPWAQPAQVPAPSPVLPPSPEGTAFAGVLGAAATGLAVKGGMFLANVSPKSLAADALITGGAMLFGGSASALGYRMSGNRHYQAAQQAIGMAGVAPGQAAGALRLNGKLGKFGQLEVNLPVQTVIDAAKAWHAITNPATPQIVDQYFNIAAQHAAQQAAQGFQQYMPPPNYWAQPPQQQVPMYAYPPPPQWQQPPQGQQPPPGGAS